jgi:RNA polymerase sigma-70 factor, ECF subfamily
MAASAESIEELYRSRYASFRGGVAAITGSYETARDVVQEAFAQALRDREQFRGEGSLAAWVWRIALRLAVRSRSSSGRRELTLAEMVEEAPLPSGGSDPELARALKRLSPQRRLIVFLRYFADLSYGEIATLCGISEGTVAATLAHARADLLNDLEREEAPR